MPTANQAAHAAHAARRDALRATLAERDVPAALVTRLLNVRYLTGFTGSHGLLLVRADGTDVLVTDGRYRDQAATQTDGVEITIERALLAPVSGWLTAGNVGRLGVETHVLTLDERATLSDGVEVVSLERAVEKLRYTKDDTELDLLRTACAISARALEGLFETRLSGRSEREIARDLESRLYAEGAEALAFGTIVASGPNSAIPHHSPTDRVVERGDFLKIDFGARHAGYHADCTRTVVVGAAPAAWQRELHELVRSAQQAGREALKPGAALSAVDAAARDVIVAGGQGGNFTHGLGHGVGLEIHEDPFFAANATGTLADRTPVTVEPGVYLPGRGGVRIEDTLVVRDGEPELLTPTTKDLVVLD